MADSRIHAVILAGGKGTRFWPASRGRRPKQLLPIVSERTMLEETVARLDGLVTADRVWVVTGADHADDVRRVVGSNVPGEHVLVEPVGRNTAPAIGLAAHVIAETDPRGIMIVLPADHHVGDTEAFRQTLAKAVDVASREARLVTLGIEPTGPETGYGYIERGEPIGGDAFAVRRFTEKPDRERAEEFVRSGRFDWNAGIFVWRVDVVLEAFVRLLPDMNDVLRDVAAARSDPARLRRGYESIRGESIDYGILEKADNVAVVPGRFGWDDIGSWAAVARLRSADTDGNVTSGRVVAVDARDNVVAGAGRLVALLGVENMVVVETDDAILVARADRAQDVRKVIEELERRGWKDVL